VNPNAQLYAPLPPQPADLRRCCGRFPTGVTVVTALSGDVGGGMTASAFTSVSLDPMLVLICIRNTCSIRPLLLEIRQFAVNILAHDQRECAEYFADPTRPRGSCQFDAVDWSPGSCTGAPILAGASASLECELADVHEAGDHSVVFGRVLSCAMTDGLDPLVFFASNFGTVADLPPARLRLVRS
jgi:flavin reductase (DIM6/NTAB) family NADH-FMN oxidoreductase RutF